jgi:HlyD family secretion protein
MKKKIFSGLVLAVALLALLGTMACDSFGGGQSTVSQQQVKVTRGDIGVVAAGNGKIEASKEARLTFGSAGKVAEILVEEGDEVKAGDVLARLDISALELAHAQSQVAVTQAELALGQAQLAQKTAEYGLKNTQDTEDALKLALLNAQINLDTANEALKDTVRSYNWDSYMEIESELNKAETFYEHVIDGLEGASEGSVGNWELALDRAEERLEIARANYNDFLAGQQGTAPINLRKKQVEAAELSVAQAQKNLDELAEDIEMQQLQVESAEKAIEQARQSVELAKRSLAESQRQLDEATIITPFDSTVAMVMVKEGDNIPSPSMVPQTIVHIIDPDYLELVIEVDEIDIPLVSLHQEADITVDALPDVVFKGVVTAVYPVPTEVGGIVLYKVRIGLDVPGDSGIKIGMSASADIVIEKHSNVLVVPSRAVRKNDQGQTVVGVMVEGQVQERAVVIGLDDGLRTEIISGLQEGETVVYEVKVKSTPMSMF